MLLAPDLMWASWQRSRAWARPLLLLALLVVAVVVVSKLGTGVPWNEVDNRARVLVMPLFALAVVALRPERAWFWSGAVVGLVGACVVVLHASFGGVLRPGGWTNPIVFADVALGLMVVAVFCRPPRRTAWVLFAQLAGLTAILLTGSRGAWPGLAVVATVAVLTGGWRLRFPLRIWIDLRTPRLQDHVCRLHQRKPDGCRDTARAGVLPSRRAQFRERHRGAARSLATASRVAAPDPGAKCAQGRGALGRPGHAATGQHRPPHRLPA